MKNIIIAAFIAIASIGLSTQAQEIHHINNNDFIEKVWDYNASPSQFSYKGNTPCIIDFYADWCGPCRQLGKNLNTIAHKYKEQIIIYKINVDDPLNAPLVQLFNIRSIPFILFINAQEINTHTGTLSVEQLDEVINQLLISTNP